MNKLIAILMSKESQSELLARVFKNPKTSILGLVAGVCFGGAAKLDDMGFKLAAMLVAGAGALMAVIGLLFAADTAVKQAGEVSVAEEDKKDPPAPPAV